MGFVEAVQSGLRNYVNFTGRASRSEFWWFFLFYIVIVIVGTIIHPILSSVASLALILPYLAVGARRLHDIGRSGWWLLLSIIPFGGFVVLYWWIKVGDPGANQFGPPPGQPAMATA
jgi:uncharacterized membrane protein YhaH (DUF805 family)